MTDRPGAIPKPPHSDGEFVGETSPAVPRDANAIEDSNGFAPTKTRATAKAGDSTETAQVVQKVPKQFGRYRLIRELGRGGMGTVMLAEDTQLGRQVALKIPFLKQGSDTRTLRRFAREAKAAAALSHPNLCAVYDFGTFESHHFLSMAYVEGRPLQQYLDSGNLIPQRTAAGIVKKIASALHHAHERGVIHRDLKPSNIMIEPTLGPVVTDFGLARCLDDDSEPQITKDGVAIGTPSYMSPEQLDGDSSLIGPQSDIFSLGLILYEMLTGQRRFQGKVTSIIGQILTKDPTSLREVRPDIHPLLDEICQKMMARDPAARYPSMAEVANVMRAYLKGELAATANQPAGAEITSDAEMFIASLAAFDHLHASPPSTQHGAGVVSTEADGLPAIVISEAESRTSQILHRRKSQRGSKRLLLGGAFLALGLAVWMMFLGGGDSEPETPQERRTPPSETLASSNQEEPEAAPDPDADGFLPFEPAMGSNPAEEPTAEAVPPSAAKVPILDSAPAAGGSQRPPAPVSPSNAVAKAPSSSTKEKPAAEPIQLNHEMGRLNLEVLVIKTISGRINERKHKIPRAAVSEIVTLEQRQKQNNKALEEVRILILLNGNVFEFAQAETARTAVTTLEDALVQSILIEEIVARLKHLNPAFAEPVPKDLTREEIASFNKQLENIYNTTIVPFVTRMNNGRGALSRADFDLAQLRYEQEAQKIKGLPPGFPIPKVRGRIVPPGAVNPTLYPIIEGDSQRYKDQSARGQVIKRVAEALNAGTLVRHPEQS